VVCCAFVMCPQLRSSPTHPPTHPPVPSSPLCAAQARSHDCEPRRIQCSVCQTRRGNHRVRRAADARTVHDCDLDRISAMPNPLHCACERHKASLHFTADTVSYPSVHTHLPNTFQLALGQAIVAPLIANLSLSLHSGLAQERTSHNDQIGSR